MNKNCSYLYKNSASKRKVHSKYREKNSCKECNLRQQGKEKNMEAVGQ